MRKTVGPAVLGGLLCLACHASVPRQPVAAPAPARPATAAAPPSAWVLRRDPVAHQYRIEQYASVVTTTDSGTTADSVSLVVEASLRKTAAGSVAGLVQSVVRSVADSAQTPIGGLTTPFAFASGAVVRGGQPNPLAQPPEPDPCIAPSSVPLNAVRDILFRAPDTLFVGRNWADSGAVPTCRGGARLTATIERLYRVAGSEVRGTRVVLLVERTSRTMMRGTIERGTDTTRVEGSGSGRMHLVIDSESGDLVSADGTGVLDLRVHATAHTERAHQLFTVRATLRP